MQRFWAKVDKLPDRIWRWRDEIITSGCWEWRGAGDNRGYGQYTYLGSKYKAHRFSWMLKHKTIQDGLWVLHKCDNKCCVNPDHLFLGTASDNMQDCLSKGRHIPGKAFGVLNGSFTHPEKIKHGVEVNTARLDDGQVRRIRANYVPKVVTRRMLAIEFGVCKRTIDCILAYATWKHI